MKKRILIILVGLLLLGVNVYAGGDLIVNGNIGVGNTNPTKPLDITSTDAGAVINLAGTLTQTLPGLTKGLNLVLDYTATGSNPNNAGAFYLVRTQGSDSTGGYITGFMGNANYESSGQVNGLNGAVNIVNINTNKTGTTHSVLSAVGNSVELRKGSTNNKIVSLTNYYGFYSFGNSAGTGGIGATNVRHAYFEDFPNYSGTFTNVAGLWIDQQTRGTNNYGIVLNGYGATGDFGAAIVFGDPESSQSVRLYAKNDGKLYVNDGFFETQHSPHDPVTGEWIFYSKNIKTGKTVRVNMEKLVKAVEKLTGETFMVETLIEDN